jgi:hypothetical protein
MSKFRFGKRLTTLAALGCLATTVACADDGDDDTAASGGSSATGGSAGRGGGAGAGGSSGSGGTGGASSAKARVRVLHLSPDAPAVDVFANGGDDPVTEGLTFPNGTPYLEVPAATYTFDVAPAGGSAEDAVLTIDAIELESGVSYTAVALDELDSITALPLVDDYAGLAAGKIRVRAVHAAAAVGEVDLWSVPESGSPAPLWTNVDFGVAGDALDVAAGAYTIGVDVDDDMTPDLTFKLPALPAGTVANVFAVNDEEGDVFLLAQLADGATARIDPE